MESIDSNESEKSQLKKFYKNLSKLLQRYQKLKDNNQNDKEKLKKSFCDYLKLVCESNIKNQESIKFRLYWIEFLNDEIDSYLPVCSENDKNYLRQLINNIKNKKNENYRCCITSCFKWKTSH